jgi:hypothetical protein
VKSEGSDITRDLVTFTESTAFFTVNLQVTERKVRRITDTVARKPGIRRAFARAGINLCLKSITYGVVTRAATV